MHTEHATTTLAIQVCLFLLATSVIVPAFRRVGVSAVVAFLAIGVLLGPDGIGRLAGLMPEVKPFVFAHSAETAWLAELGVVFLLFAIGLEVSSQRLWALRRTVLGLGGLQMATTAAVITGVAIAFGNAFSVAAVTGLAFALSSTAVVLQLLGEKRQLSGTVGRTGFSVLLFQDLAVVPILFLVAALGAEAAAAAPMDSSALGLALAKGAVAIAAILLIGRFVMRPLLAWAASVRSREVFVATALLMALGAALIAQAAGLSMALGAFLAGLMLAETEFRHEIETDVEPFKGLLLGLFFVTVGMQLDLDLLAAEPLRVLIGVVGLIIVKAAILAPLARAFGLSWPKAIELSLLLSQAGEFAFVIIAMATASGLYPDAVAQYMLAVVALSLLVTPLVASAGARLARAMERNAASVAPDIDADALESHVIIAGYGRVGQMLGAIVQEQGLSHIAVDADPNLAADLRKKGWPVHVGDVSRRDMLERLGASRASAIVVTLNNFEAAERVVAMVRATWPNTPVYARARDAAQALRLREDGVRHAIPETTEGALQLAGAVLEGIGIPDEAVRRIIDLRRDLERI